MDIKVERVGTDVVNISADDRVYYAVSYNPTYDNWEVVKHTHGVIGYGVDIGAYNSAKEAVEKVKAMLTEKGDELTDAISGLA